MDVFGKPLDVGDRALILSPLAILDGDGAAVLSQTGIIFGIAAEDAYVVYLDGPSQKGWEGWGSSVYILAPGKYLMKYNYEWSYT